MKASSLVRLSSFRIKEFVWLLLAAFLVSSMPSVCVAQQPTTAISTLSGKVLVNGQEQGKGAVLSAGDVLETQAGASVVLALSDGSTLELGEKTKLDLAVLSQTATGTRTSKVKLLWGRIRAKLAPGHQQAGSTFDIETPNALAGVKFSQPDVEVSYDLVKQETKVLALTVAVAVINLITNEKIIVPVGTTAIITALGIKLMAGAVASKAAVGALSTKTIAIGAGALVALGGIAAVAGGGGGNDNDSGSVSGRCNDTQVSGAETPETRVIEMGRKSGTFQFYYDTVAVPDWIVVEYEGHVLLDTGCVGDTKTLYLTYSGDSTRITVRVTPDCQRYGGTYWEFIVYCPQ